MKRLYNQAKYILQDLQTPQRKEEQEASKSMVNQAEAQLMLARLRMERYEKLYEMKAGNLDEAEAALQHFREITALKKQREHEYSISKMGARKSIVLAQIQKAESIHAKLLYIIWELSQKTRFAPMDAIVFDTYYSEGEWVPPGKPVASLLNYKGNEVEFFVPVRLLKKFQLGQQISVTCSGCKHKEKAMISFISPEAEYTPPLVYSQSNYDKIVFKLRAKPLHPKLFKPGEPVVISGF